MMLACNPKPQDGARVDPEPATVDAPPPSEEPVEPEDPEAAEREEARQRARNAPPPAGLAAGLVSDFEGGQLGSEFGAGWQKGSDEMTGGSSTVELEVTDGALRIDGTIDEGSLPDAWAGAMFFPGDQAMRPANLRDKPTLVVQARGDGPLMVKIFSERNGTTPVTTSVEIGEDWGRYEVDMSTLVDEPYDVTAIFLGVPAQAGSWTVWIDDVRLR